MSLAKLSKLVKLAKNNCFNLKNYSAILKFHQLSYCKIINFSDYHSFLNNNSNKTMSYIKGLAAVVSKNAKVLILGSMPSVASLEAQQYYAHPRNHFWQIMNALFAVQTQAAYQKRLDILIKNRLALWDVLKQCQRPGSLDSAIDEKSIIVNDFVSFYQQHPNISVIFFNGSKAEQIYKRYVQAKLNQQYHHLCYRLPSTSPANASLNLAAKTEKWRIICCYLNELNSS